MGWRELEEYQEKARLAEWLGSAGFGVASQPSGEPARLTTAHQKENSLDAHPRGANCSPLTELSRNHTPSGIGEKSARLQATVAKVSMS
jgi:hypothetical protein